MRRCVVYVALRSSKRESIDTRLTIQSNHLLVSISGRYDHLAALELVSQVAGAARRGGVEQLLIDASQMEGEFHIDDRKRLVRQVGGLISKHLKISIVAHPDDIGQSVFETYGRDIGLNVAVFQTLAEAEAWLK